MKILITGGCGFLGSNLALKGINCLDEVWVFDNLSRIGASENLNWLKSQGVFKFVYGDIRNINDVDNIVKEGFDCVFHTAGQVAMTTSLANPRYDFEINALGTFNLLESVRKYCPKAVVIFSSTNKVYGDLEQFSYTEKANRYVCDQYPNGFDEDIQLDFSSNYGCSKGAADQFVKDYYKSHNLNTIVFRHSTMYGGRQFATFDQGWIGWFCQKAIEISNDKNIKPFTICGNGKQVRDILHVDDVVKLYYESAKQYKKLVGQTFNIGGGIDNSLSLLELFLLLERLMNIKMKFERLPTRLSDQKVFISGNSICKLIDWKIDVSASEGIKKMLGWLKI